MRGVRGVRVGALLVALGLVVAACGGGSDDGGDASTGGSTAEAKKVGVVYDIGGRGDKSFNDSAYAGLQAAEKEQGDKIQAKDVEPNPDGSNRKELLDGLADEGYGLIFGIGFLFSEDIAKSAAESPDTQFAVIDGFAESCTKPDQNLLCIGFKEEEGSFLVGAAAALKTKSNIVGFVGGQQGQGLIEKFQAGYEAGVKYIADQDGKSIKVLVDYAGNTPEAFRNPAKGKELALKQIGEGADVIYHASGGTGAGRHRHRRRQEGLRHRRRLRPEPDRQPGRAEVDPHLDAQAGRQRRPADHRRIRERHREGRHQDLRAQGGRHRLRPEPVQQGAAGRHPDHP